MPELFSGADIAAAATAPAPDASAASDPSTTAAGVLPAEDTASTGPAVGADGVPTTEPVPATATAVDPAPPEQKWPKILENARTKAIQETEAKFAWATQIPERHRTTVRELYQTLDTDPARAIEALIATAQHDPMHAPALRSLMGRLLGNRTPDRSDQTSAPPTSVAGPEPDFQDEQGHTFYSAERMKQALSALKAEIKAEYAKEITPLKTDLQSRHQREVQVKAERDAATWAETRYATVSQWPHFTKYEAEIAKALTADPDLDVGDAYIGVVMPHVSQQERSAVVASLRDKASAASPNPASPASGVSKAPTSFREAFARLPAEAWGR